jgi:TonB family protein
LSERLNSNSETEELAELDTHSSGAAAEGLEKQETESTFSSEGVTPNFGLSLAIDAQSTDAKNDSKGSGKGLKFALLAAGLLLAAGAWYWYSTQPKNVSANEGTTAQTNFGASAAASSSSSSPATTKSKSLDPALGKDVNRNPVDATPVRTDSAGSATSASHSPQPGASADNSFKPSTPATTPGVDPSTPPAVDPEKKPSLGNVHLGAPVVRRRAASADNNSADAELAISGNGVTGGDAGTLNILASKDKQPAAPVPIGGEVKQARLLSSVAPQYPQMARNQRLSGDVKVDALVDANGRVTAMKVISGPALLHQAAMDALRQWKYEPATLNGRPMAVHLTVTVQFKLQ